MLQKRLYAKTAKKYIVQKIMRQTLRNSGATATIFDVSLIPPKSVKNLLHCTMMRAINGALTSLFSSSFMRDIKIIRVRLAKLTAIVSAYVRLMYFLSPSAQHRKNTSIQKNSCNPHPNTYHPWCLSTLHIMKSWIAKTTLQILAQAFRAFTEYSQQNRFVTGTLNETIDLIMDLDLTAYTYIRRYIYSAKSSIRWHAHICQGRCSPLLRDSGLRKVRVLLLEPSM
mmetsp:Transcript_9682/g.14583  ORF Transcript_9682/g.14583 Transcript_9682/m.14583 type:complete len:226 (-) Transcript_9682:1216-1893(-)